MLEKLIFNGEFIDRSASKVDVEDRGYQFGDGVYEVIRVYNGKLFTSQMHLDRLIDSAKKISLDVGYTAAELEILIQQLVTENQLTYGTVYMQFTRGAAPRNHAFPVDKIQSVFVAYTKVIPYGGEVKPGKQAITTEDIRWLRCDIKSLNLLGNILAKQQAVEKGCFEAIQHRGDTITEGSSSNISIVKDNVLITHPPANLILNGITRRVMLHLCQTNGISYREESFTISEMINADEVIMTSTSAEITPITLIDGKVIGAGTPGPITNKLQQLFHQEIEMQCGRVYSTT